MPNLSAGRISPAIQRAAFFQDSPVVSPDWERGWIQPELLGRPVQDTLTSRKLKEETRQASAAMLQTLDFLMAHAFGARQQHEQEVARRLEARILLLRRYATGKRLSSSALQAAGIDAMLRDVMHFVVLADTAARLQGRLALVLLPHLIGLALVRYKLEAHWRLHGEVMFTHGSTGQLNQDEIAAVCELKPASIKNAVSRGELPQTDSAGVPIPQALDWMVTRQRFLFLPVSRKLPSRQINGKIASLWLEQQPTAAFIKKVTRLRMNVWQLGNTETVIGVNAGVRHCVLTVPFEPFGVEGLEVRCVDRTHDKEARLLREGLGAATTAPIWQLHLTARQDFEALMKVWLCPIRPSVTKTSDS